MLELSFDNVRNSIFLLYDDSESCEFCLTQERCRSDVTRVVAASYKVIKGDKKPFLS